VRFERHGGVFTIIDLPEELEPAARKLAFSAEPAFSAAWSRRFPADSPHLEPAWENFQRLIGPALRQAAGLDPVPWEAALAEVCRRLNGAGVDWWLGGSGALAARGIAVSPGDLDLIVSDADSHRVGDLLLDGLIEPVARVDWFSRWFGRAMLGARVEWAGGVGPAADQPEITDFGPAAAARLEVVRWRGHQIRVPPLELQRLVSARRGLAERVRLIDRRQPARAPDNNQQSSKP
jgi:hypothetical protein